METQLNLNKVLLLTSNNGAQSGRSGYDLLAQYLNNGRTIAVKRKAPSGLLGRFRQKIYRRRAASSWCLLSSLELEKRAAQSMRDGSCRRVHLLWGDRDWGGLDLIANQLGLPFVVSVHGCPDELPSIFPDRKRLLNPSAILLMSQQQEAYFLESGVPPERLHVVPHGIDVEYFHPKEKEPSRPEELRILTVGSYRRNFALLERVIKTFPVEAKVRFVIVSGASRREQFSVYPNVEFLSGLSNEDLLRAYQQADIFLMTAKAATANNAMVEALACGLPVVCEKVGGLPEYAPETCAIHTRPDSSEAMVEALLELAGNSQKRTELALAARQQAESLRWENCARKVEEIYSSICGKTNP